MTDINKNNVYNDNEDSLVLEKGFEEPTTVDETVSDSSESSFVSSEKSDVYFENLTEDELAQAEAEVAAELERTEKRKKDKENARKKDKKIFQEVHEKHERDMAAENDRRSRLDIAAQDADRDDKTLAYLNKLNQEGYERQLNSENYKSFGTSGIDYSGNDQHSAYKETGDATVHGSKISENEYRTLRENYEKSRELFKSYGENVPESVVDQYKADSEQYFVVQRKIDNGEIKVSENVSDGSNNLFHTQSEQQDRSDYIKGENPFVAAVPESSFEKVPVRSASGVAQTQPSDTSPLDSSNTSYSLPLEVVSGTTGDVLSPIQPEQPHNEQQFEVGESATFVPSSSSEVVFVTEDNYKTLRENYENSRELFKSYGDNVPESVVDQYKADSEQYFAVQRKIDNGEIKVSSEPQFNNHEQTAPENSVHETSFGVESDDVRNEHQNKRTENDMFGVKREDRDQFDANSETNNGASPAQRVEYSSSFENTRPTNYPSDGPVSSDSLSDGKLNTFQQAMAYQAAVVHQQTSNDNINRETADKFDTKAPNPSESVYHISQSRYDLLKTKYTEVQKEVASYSGSEVPQSVSKKAEKINKVYFAIQDKIDSGSIQIVHDRSSSSRSKNIQQGTSRNTSGKSSSAPKQAGVYPVGAQVFSERSKDNFSADSKRTGNRYIKPATTPVQGSPISRYDKLKIYHTHNYARPIDRATQQTVGALSYAFVRAARDEQSGTANTMYSGYERTRDAINTAKVLKDLPRQLKNSYYTAQNTVIAVQNVGRFLQGKGLLSFKENSSLTIKQIDKALAQSFSSFELPNMKKKFGDNAFLSIKKINKNIVIETAKNKGLKAEIQRLNAKTVLTSEERKHLVELIKQKKVADQKLRNLHGAKIAQEKAFARNRKADRTNTKDAKKTIKKNSKKDIKLSKTDKTLLSRLRDRLKLLEQREKLAKVMQSRKQLFQSAGILLSNVTRESEDSTIQGLMRADRVLQNRYVRSILKASTKAVLLPGKLAFRGVNAAGFGIEKAIRRNTKEYKKLSDEIKLLLKKRGALTREEQANLKSLLKQKKLWDKEIDQGLLKTSLKKATDKTVDSVVNSRAFKELNGGIYNRVKKGISSRTPDKIKTRIKNGQKTLSDLNSKRKTVLNKFNALKKRLQNSKVGKLVSVVSNGFGRLASAFKFAKGLVLKIGLYCASFVIVVALIGAAITSVSGAVNSFFLGDDGDSGKIDVSKYIKILNNKEQEFLEDVDYLASDPDDKYEVVTVNYQSGTLVNNFKEILSMTAVYFDQDFSDEETVKAYIHQLYEDSHYYLTEESEPYACSGCETRSYSCTSYYDEFATNSRKALFDTYAERGGCEEHEHTGYNYCQGCVVDDNGVPTNVCSGHEYTYYTYSCSGHEETICRGEHVDLDINVMVLGFDDIFYADSSVGYSTTGVDTSLGNVVRGDEIGTFTITYYCTERYPHICNAGPPYKTASGTVVTPGRTIAVDKSKIPLGTHVIINGHEYIAEDTGGAIKGNRIDIAVATHAEALNLGKKTYKVYYTKASGDSSNEAQRSVAVSYLDYASDAANDGISKKLVLKAFGQAKDPKISWKEDRVKSDTPESFDLKLREFDSKHKSEPFTNAELNTFEYVKMTKDELVALAKEKTGKDESDSTIYLIITNVLIPYDKEHPDEYVVDPDTSSAEVYFGGWTADNVEWVKNIYENFTSDNYEGLDKINHFSGNNVSYEGVTFTQGETQVVYYNQYDVRWKNLPYSSSTIGKSGCGPTSMAIVVSSLTNETVDPIAMCNWASKNGYYIKGTGTSWDFISGAASNWGLSCQDMGKGNADKVVSALSKGKLVVMSTGPGSYYSGKGHFIVLRGVDKYGKILVADPASKEKSETSWTLEQIMSGLKNWWIIG